MKIIAVVGSRDIRNTKIVENYLLDFISKPNNILPLISFVTGGARGVDTCVVNFSRKHNIPYNVIRPINVQDKISYLFRNVEIVTLADFIIAFWDGKSKGTKFVIDYAKARKKEVIIINI
jgi:hypothetical protein